ncbi:MAG: metallophosphoesterase [Pseudomonadota bacterium]
MSISRWRLSGLLFSLLATAVVCAQQPAAVQWNGIAKVIAFADVHGAYNDLHELLRDAGVLDAQDHWAAGRTHVVSLGDLMDRGPDSRKVLDLLMRLQDEALAAGGQLHVLLGNHEAMNLMGDLRYVTPAEFAAYADLETPADRAGSTLPSGYFGKRAAFLPDGKYGKWLLAQPAVIKINDTLFMHAGPGSALKGLSLQELDLRYRTALTDYLGLVSRLEQAKLLQPGDEYDARPRVARERLAALAASGSPPDPALSDMLRRLEVALANPLLSEDGPNWYRGAALCNEVTESDILLPLLQQFGAARVVVGHTPTRDGRVVTRFDGRVIKLDTGMNRAVYRGHPAALFLEPGLSVRYAGEPKAVPLQPEGLFVAPNEVDDASVLAALRDGEVTVTGPRAPNELAVSASFGGKKIPAVFLVLDANAVKREIAAYRIDRMLGLGFVPATVEREVQGQRGVVQGRPLKWVTQADVSQQGLRGGGWCSIPLQFQMMYAFDTLIGNENRTPRSILFDSDDWLVYGTSYERAFGTGAGLPAYLKTQPPAPGAEFRRRVGLLEESGLKSGLGEQLDSRALKAILERRNLLLKLPAAAAASP